ncbi:hypothetical protein AVEN_209620-1 [Araneus ventricosus]|uniref:Uncharacterized protein n=1 Tax=Araneus ventricosus TaxID=182803 RepID=A0A4Y2D5F6_ARAVE|nr:hypothetical protein AVEN_209620-1 [Araneus ventricosus]
MLYERFGLASLELLPAEEEYEDVLEDQPRDLNEWVVIAGVGPNGEPGPPAEIACRDIHVSFDWSQSYICTQTECIFQHLYEKVDKEILIIELSGRFQTSFIHMSKNEYYNYFRNKSNPLKCQY